MRNRYFGAALAAALMLGACDAPTGAGVDLAGGDNVDGPVLAVDYALVPAGAARYGLAATTTTAPAPAALLPIAGVTASSERNTYFPARYLTDGNLHSAWSPGASDDAPTLTLDLGTRARLAGIGLKLSEADVTVDVAVRNGTTWKTVATGLAPEPATLSDLDLAACEGDQVRLTFHGQEVAKLLVCEVEVRGTAIAGASPTPTPSTSATPSTAPSASPSAAPTTTPTAAPTDDANCAPCGPVETPKPDDDCVVIGGGFTKKVKFKRKKHVTFVVDVDRRGKRTIVVHDLVKKTQRVGECRTVKRHGNVAMMEGVLDTGERFTCTVVDGGRVGASDTWSFTCDDGEAWSGHFGKGHGRVQVRDDDDGLDLLPVALPDLADLDRRCEQADEDDEDARGWHRGKGKGHEKARGKGHAKHGDD